jgi:hypothetical protein
VVVVELVFVPRNAVTPEKAETAEAVNAVRSDASDEREEILAATDVKEEPPEDPDAVEVSEDMDLGGEMICAGESDGPASGIETEILGTDNMLGCTLTTASSACGVGRGIEASAVTRVGQ